MKSVKIIEEFRSLGRKEMASQEKMFGGLSASVPHGHIGFTVSLKPCLNLCSFNDTHKEKLFYSIWYNSGCLGVSDLFHVFSQSVKFYALHYHILKSTDV